VANEIIDVVSDHDPLARWEPVVGEETLSLLDRLRFPPADTDGRPRLLREARTTLSRCYSPTDSDGHDTGLVIGYVQSGKTTSFTTVSALARDNGYRLLVVCTGVTRSLFNQSAERLQRDLALNDRHDRKWMFFPNPRSNDQTEQMIQVALETDRTVLIAVMKQGNHLDNLSRLLSRLPLRTVPALIIDDEADQASLNNYVRRGTQSATYRRILALRDLVPHHTFLQYTATPQAMLLISLIDLLSPTFADILTPGPMYTGGRTFFEGDMNLVREIPVRDIPSDSNQFTGPPDSLLEAMRVYWLGVAAALLVGAQGNRSMMVHPSQRTLPHADYYQWVRQVQRLWGDVLALSADDSDYQELIDSFRTPYGDLAQTTDDLPTFEEVVANLRDAIRHTIVTQVNAARGRTPEPNWRAVFAHIVVGGEVLNRGVTVEGLTVTYMPRGAGTKQADTIQQRARWFGYKADYLGYCRVYVSNEMRVLYAANVEHETHLRNQLFEYRATGLDLRRWRRAFFIDPSLRPTRNSVISLEPIRGGFADEWFAPKAPHDPVDAVPENQETVNRFLSSLGNVFAVDQGYSQRTPQQTHLVAREVSLQAVYSELLTRLWLGYPSDSAKLAGLLLQVGRYLEDNPAAECTIYQMSEGATRERALDAAGEIPQLFQGANYDESVTPRLTVYPGDREIRTDGELTVQVHTLKVKEGTNVVNDNVPTIAVWVPRVMRGPWASQPPT